jgi:hypothetical protein
MVRAETLGFVHNLAGRDENKLSLLVHELDEPGTSDAIDSHFSRVIHFIVST